MLIVLVEIGETTVSLLRSSYLHVIGDETRWPDMADLLSGAGAAWNGAAFFQADRAGLVDDATARQRLASLTRHLRKDRSILDPQRILQRAGLRLKIERGLTEARDDSNTLPMLRRSAPPARRP